MLSNNLKRIRKSKGLSQEELAIKLNIVRQTVSKWENGLSVPDSDMLITLADELDTSVSVLLGETVMEPMTDDLKAISEKLEVINLQLAKRNMFKDKNDSLDTYHVMCVYSACFYCSCSYAKFLSKVGL